MRRDGAVVKETSAMHFLRARPLAQKLSRNSLSVREIVRYFVLFVFLHAIWSVLPNPDYTNPTLAWIAAALFMAVELGGIFVCSAANSRIDGKAFLERYICLYCPTYIVLFLIVVPLEAVIDVLAWRLRIASPLVLMLFFHPKGISLIDLATVVLFPAGQALWIRRLILGLGRIDGEDRDTAA